jgi:UDP-glucuronate decarboxylase
MNIKHPIIEQDSQQILNASLPWEHFSGKNIIVTGSTGMIGGYITVILYHLSQQLDNPPCIHILVRDKNKATAYFNQLLGKNFHIYESLESCDFFPDFIFHAASPASPKNFATDPLDVIKANVFNTWEILNKFKCNSLTKFIFISSPIVYGQIPDNVIYVGEDDFYASPTLNVRSCYEESKRMAETLLACWNFQYGIDYTIVRPSHTFGPGLKLDDGRAFGDFLKSAIEGEDIVLNSDGKTLRAFCYLADSVEAIFYATLVGEKNTCYNVGGELSNRVTILDFAKAVQSLAPEKKINIIHGLIDMKTQMSSPVSGPILDINKIKSLGWIPTTDLISSLKRTYEYLS